MINTAGTYWTDGVEALADHLQRLYNLTINPTTVYRILKREGIRYGTHQPRTTKRWKKQLFAHQTPGLELQMDTKFPLGYKQGRVQQQAPFVIQKIRTDQGKEFRANVVREYLAQQQIVHRLNTPYCPEEKGKIERFHRTLNEKCVVGMHPNDQLDTLQYKLTLFLQYYNWQKRHRGLGMDGVTPMQKLDSCAGGG